MTDAELREIFLAFPGVEEAPSYGTPGFRVRKKLLARFHQVEPAVVLKVLDLDEQAALIASDSKAFYVTDHYEGHPYVLVHRAKRNRGRIRDVFEVAWRNAPPKRLVTAYDEER